MNAEISETMGARLLRFGVHILSFLRSASLLSFLRSASLSAVCHAHS